VDEGVAGGDREMLRVACKAHQEQIARAPVVDHCDALQTGLAIERLLQLAAGRRAPVTGHVEMPDADLARDVDRHPRAVQTKTEQPPLVAKRRAEALPRGSENIVGRHQPPCPTCA
jgi:hypothetical protein